MGPVLAAPWWALLILPCSFADALRVQTGSQAGTGQFPLDAVQRKKRQVMHNFMDVQYYTDLAVGGQTITGLLDTGSFDLVVFDTKCEQCGTAKKYSSIRSSSFLEGRLDQVLYYGSGSIDVRQGFDKVAIGPFDEVNLTFWDAVGAAMPVLRHAAFNSIIGVGPPETPGSDAWTVVSGDVRVVREGLERGPKFPSVGTQDRLIKDADLATALATQPTLIRADAVTRFSICLGRKAGSAGYFVWNDTTQEQYPPLFTWVKVIGRHTWTVNMTNMRLASRQSGIFGDVVDCWDGCGAIIDSGTSLLLMPFDAIAALRGHLRMMNVDCSNVDSLPSLTFSLDGKEFSLPPDAYIAKMRGSETTAAANVTSVSSNFAAERVPLTFGGGDCELSVMGSSSYTNWGPLWILGMPFFRKYYTSFEVGSTHDERGLYITPATSNCTPVQGDTDLVRLRNDEEEEQELRTVNVSHVLIPRLAHKAMTQSFVPDL